jgi:hypothetical protein
MPLVTYANLMAPAVTAPSLRVADLCLTRMKDPTKTMPPAPAVPPSAAEIATFESWVAAGAPSTCASGGGSGGAGNGADASSPDALGPIVCTSNQHWAQANRGSSSMRPGGACISCHAMSGGEAPAFVVAGTVYPTAREPDDCNGINGTTSATTVVIVDANNRSTSVPVNAVGNFYMQTSTPVALPFRAKVVRGGAERAMLTPQMTGDCNSCHTQDGANGAPGRIVAP